MKKNNILRGLNLLVMVIAAFGVSACSPTVKVEAPKEPIRIDVNVNIEHKVKIEIDKDLDKLLDSEKGLF